MKNSHIDKFLLNLKPTCLPQPVIWHVPTHTPLIFGDRADDQNMASTTGMILMARAACMCFVHIDWNYLSLGHSYSRFFCFMSTKSTLFASLSPAQIKTYYHKCEKPCTHPQWKNIFKLSKKLKSIRSIVSLNSSLLKNYEHWQKLEPKQETLLKLFNQLP